MPLALFLALAASLGLHAAVLFGTQIEQATEIEPAPLLAELRPIERPPPVPVAKPQDSPVRKARPPRRVPSEVPVPSVEHVVPSQPVADDVGESSVRSVPGRSEAEAIAPPAPGPAAASVAQHRIPEHGVVHYRVERGDQGFEIGFARQTWHIADGQYRLESLLETTGLVWLFKSVRIEMESRGQLGVHGLRPEAFSVRRNGVLRERATFDWQTMTVRIAERAAEPMHSSTQDLLSFQYQLGYLPQLPQGEILALATGKKYGVYRLEVIGDETLELPVGTLRTLHLRAPGVNTTELWLAYDYLMLPVKIRHLDSQGDSLVQVATEIQMSPE